MPFYLVLFAIGTYSLAAQDSNFVRVNPREDIEILVPRTWRVAPTALRRAQATVAEAAVTNSGRPMPKGATGNLYIAFSPEETPWAEIRLSGVSPATTTVGDALSASPRDLSILARTFQAALEKVLPQFGSRTVGAFAARRDQISGVPAIVIEGGRTHEGSSAVLKTQTNRLIFPDQEIILTFAWDPKGWEPVVQAMRKSIAIRRK